MNHFGTTISTSLRSVVGFFYAAFAGWRPLLPLPDPNCKGVVKAVQPVGNFFVGEILGLASAYWWWWVVVFVALLAGGVAAFKAGKKLIPAVLWVFAAGLLLIVILGAPEAFFPKMKGGC